MGIQTDLMHQRALTIQESFQNNRSSRYFRHTIKDVDINGDQVPDLYMQARSCFSLGGQGGCSDNLIYGIFSSDAKEAFEFYASKEKQGLELSSENQVSWHFANGNSAKIGQWVDLSFLEGPDRSMLLSGISFDNASEETYLRFYSPTSGEIWIPLHSVVGSHGYQVDVHAQVLVYLKSPRAFDEDNPKLNPKTKDLFLKITRFETENRAALLELRELLLSADEEKHDETSKRRLRILALWNEISPAYSSLIRNYGFETRKLILNRLYQEFGISPEILTSLSKSKEALAKSRAFLNEIP